MTTGRFVAYYRVSTDKQGKSGLGLEAQRLAVTNYLNGGRWKMVAEFTEVESGKRKDRPKLAEAIAACRVYGATLVIAKLDRLARNVAFVSNLMESGVDFVAVDFPQANRLTVHILAAVAEHERAMISERTRAALAAAKARDAKLPRGKRKQIGGMRGNSHAIHRLGVPKSLAARVAGAQSHATNLAPMISQIRAEGATTVRAIADELNERGVPSRRGGAWGPSQVMRLLKRLAETPQAA
ncbi:recombinase family protein [Ferrovibrio sp.]|uniref:recombinase family protein n=1 Tax=Ferrovibrio sp. TaxID=1917215 RepID=UPI00311D836A